jgi:hypothetical protein
VRRRKPIVRRQANGYEIEKLQRDAQRLNDEIARRLFMEEAMRQRCCQVPDCPHPRMNDWDAHHVVYKQELRRMGVFIWEPRDALRICDTCHERHHKRHRPIPIVALRDCNIDYAFEIMGIRAYNYLTRHYAGGDPRIEVWRSRLEPATETSPSSAQEPAAGSRRD